jgi:hypothetical protein
MWREDEADGGNEETERSNGDNSVEHERETMRLSAEESANADGRKQQRRDIDTEYLEGMAPDQSDENREVY